MSTNTPDEMPRPDGVCDGGDLDCGSGLLLIIRNAMQPIAAGGVLEVRSRERSVREDLPAWCRLVGHSLLGITQGDNDYSNYFIRRKGTDDELQQDLHQARDYRWRVRVRWDGGMRARAFVRNHTIEVGQPASFDTEDVAPSAIEYLLSALAADLAVGLQWRASQKGIDIAHLEVSLSARADDILVFLGVEDDGHPGLAGVEGKVFIDTTADPEELDELWTDTVRRSPLVQTLLKGAAVDVELRTT